MAADFKRSFLFILLSIVTVSLVACPLWADEPDEELPVSIKSPEEGKTFAYGDIKSRSLSWQPKRGELVAHVTFTNQLLAVGSPEEDDEYFPIPGISFDPASGTFYATAKTGEKIPIAKMHTAVLFKTIVMLPNAAVRVIHTPEGNTSVILEAIRPADLARYQNQPYHDGAFNLGSIFK
jgi:hypothetical protein